MAEAYVNGLEVPDSILRSIVYTSMPIVFRCEYICHKMQEPESHLSSGRFMLYEGGLDDAKFETKFDKILSIGVFCHVDNLTTAFQN